MVHNVPQPIRDRCTASSHSPEMQNPKCEEKKKQTTHAHKNSKTYLIWSRATRTPKRTRACFFHWVSGPGAGEAPTAASTAANRRQSGRLRRGRQYIPSRPQWGSGGRGWWRPAGFAVHRLEKQTPGDLLKHPSPPTSGAYSTFTQFDCCAMADGSAWIQGFGPDARYNKSQRWNMQHFIIFK